MNLDDIVENLIWIVFFALALGAVVYLLLKKVGVI